MVWKVLTIANWRWEFRRAFLARDSFHHSFKRPIKLWILLKHTICSEDDSRQTIHQESPMLVIGTKHAVDHLSANIHAISISFRKRFEKVDAFILQLLCAKDLLGSGSIFLGTLICATAFARELPPTERIAF